jgi:hypothetical protein
MKGMKPQQDCTESWHMVKAGLLCWRPAGPEFPAASGGVFPR